MTWPVPYSVAMNDPRIAALDYEGPSWACARLVHAALDGELMPVDRVPNAVEIWREIAGGRPWPTRAPSRFLICGSRRISKTREFVARRAAWRCATFEPRGRLAPGELGVAAIACPDRMQATVAMGYATAFLEQSELLRKTIDKVTAQEILFTTHTALRITTASQRTSRGFTLIDAKDDEGAHMWDSDTHVNPLSAVLAAQEPALGTIRDAQLGITSTPRGRAGEFYRLWARGWGKDDPRWLVLTIPWHIGNPTLDAEMIREAVEADPAVAASEWNALFRTDLEGYVTREVITKCTEDGVRERAPVRGVRYVAFADPSGGGADSFTLAIAHREPDGYAVLDAVRETRPGPSFSFDATVREYAELLRAYAVHSVTADNYGAGISRERWGAAGIFCEPSAYTKSELYGRLLPMMNSGRCTLLDIPRLANQLLSLERRVARGSNRESIDSPGHEDVANAAAGALVLVSVPRCGGGEATKIGFGSGSGGGSPTNLSIPDPRPTRLVAPFRYGDGPRQLPVHLRRMR